MLPRLRSTIKEQGGYKAEPLSILEGYPTRVQLEFRTVFRVGDCHARVQT